MPRSLRLPPVLFALGLLLTAAPLAAGEHPSRPHLTPEVLKDAQRTDWYGVYLQNKKMGYIKTALQRVGHGEDAGYRLTMLLRVQALSAGEKLDIEQSQEELFDTRPPYRLRRAHSVDKVRDSRQETVLTRAGDGYRVTTSANGEKTARSVPSLDFTLADTLASYVWLRGRPRPGATVLTQDLDLNEMRLDRERRKVLAVKKALAKGVPLTYYEVEATLLRHKITTLERYDEQGNLLSGRIGEAFEMRLETEAQAKNVEAGTDLFVLGLVKIDRPLGNARTITSLSVEVKGKDSGLLDSGPRQAISRDSSGAVILKLGKAHGQPARATPEEVKDNLAGTVSYPVSNTRVQELARKAVGDATTDLEKVKRLVHFVHHYIRPSYRGKGLIVLDLLEKKEGDCTAYAALLTTLARAAGIPCREMSGLLYTGDSQKAFGGHAWNEVVIDGQWVPVDASCGETEVDATHISFGSDVRGGLNLLQSYGSLSLRLLDVRHRGHK
jgi:hypothetical protein